MENQSVDWKRISIYLTFAFGIAWLAGLALYLTGGLANNPYRLWLLTVGYMGAPAFAHILTRLVTREGLQNLYLKPNIRKGWLYWVICLFAPAFFIVIGMAIFFALFPQYYDPNLTLVQTMFGTNSTSGEPAVKLINPWLIVFSQTGMAILISPLLNALPILGEEFGWRAYLQQKLWPLGGRKTMILMGVIWGLWHAPVIAMGHNYGSAYAGAPWLGILAMIWFTFLFGTFIGWAVLKAGSVWPAVIAHGALNGLAGISVFFIRGNPNLILGPIVAGIIGSLAIACTALAIFILPHSLKPNP